MAVAQNNRALCLFGIFLYYTLIYPLSDIKGKTVQSWSKSTREVLDLSSRVVPTECPPTTPPSWRPLRPASPPASSGAAQSKTCSAPRRSALGRQAIRPGSPHRRQSASTCPSSWSTKAPTVSLKAQKDTWGGGVVRG